MIGKELLLVVATLFAVAGVAVVAVRWLGARLGYLLSGVCVAMLAVLVDLGLDVLRRGEPLHQAVGWLPQLGVDLAFRLDGLSLLFSAVVLAVGAVVLAYCPSYVRGHVSRVGVFYAALTAFAASMVGLVLAANAVVLYVFWELTTVASFLLIRLRGDQDAVEAANRALLITFAGGLCLLGGAVVAAGASGTFELVSWTGSPESLGGSLTPVLVLVLLAAATKSAQVPFHVWLPGAMVAPTPVSAYLHAAAMVKAGVYLLARITPLLQAHHGMRSTVIVVGLATALVGSVAAFRRDDLKIVLAYSTVGQLGLMVALLGVGSGAAVAAALLHVVAHAGFKSSLFLVAGTLEHGHGSRDLRRLSGVARTMPATTAAAVLAITSMAGIPPLLGFVSKEEALASLAQHGDVAALVAAVMVFAFTVAYSLRILVATLRRDGQPGTHRTPTGLWLAPAVTAMAGMLGLAVGLFDRPIAAAAGTATRVSVETGFGLWHGPTAAFWAALTATALGILLFAAHGAVRRVPALPDGAEFADAIERALRRFGGYLARPLVSPAPARHLSAVIVVSVAVLVVTWPDRSWPPEGSTEAPVAEWVLAGLLVAAAVGVAQARDRFAGLAALAAVGFLVAAFYVLRGAPDLALTQLVVDALSVALLAFVFRYLPRDYPRVSRLRTLASSSIAVVAGVTVGAVSVQLIGRDGLSEVATHYLEAAEAKGAHNVVNAIVTGFRPLDTLGEVTVLTVAAIGVVALLRSMDRERR